jgi:hypothetical protein
VLSAMSSDVKTMLWSWTFEDPIRRLPIFQAPERSELQP